MGKLKIGFFDSGVGGISVMTSARGALPNADYIYYADEAHVPYGTKSHEEIIRYADEAVGCLVSRGVHAVVVACNTATSIAIEYLREKYTLPIIGMEPALKPAVKAHPNEKILLCATPVTIAGEKLHHLIEKSGAEPTLVPLPGLVTFAENCVFDKEQVCAYLAGEIGDTRDFAAVILGCTHFSFFRDCFRALFGNDVDIIDGNTLLPCLGIILTPAAKPREVCATLSQGKKQTLKRSRCLKVLQSATKEFWTYKPKSIKCRYAPAFFFCE